MALLLLIIFAPFIIHSGALFLGIFASIMLYTFAQANQVVHGFADDQGIHYKRYFSWRSASWGQIQSITKQSVVMISIDLEERNILGRHLVFLKDIDVFRPLAEAGDFTTLREAWMRGRKP